MKYVDPVQYSKQMRHMMGLTEMEVPNDGHTKVRSQKQKIESMTPEKQEELNQYLKTIKEIKRKIHEMLNEPSLEEQGGPKVNLHLNTEEEGE